MKFDYNSRKWRRKSKHILMLDGYRDVVLGWYGIRTEANIDVYKRQYRSQRYSDTE